MPGGLLSSSSHKVQEWEADGVCRIVVPATIIDEIEHHGITRNGLLYSPSCPEDRLMLQTLIAHAAPQWCAEVPSLYVRRQLAVAELPSDMRRDLWFSVLSSTTLTAQQQIVHLSSKRGVDGVEMGLDNKPTALRVKSLYDDLQRNKFQEYGQGEGMERVRALVLSFLDSSWDNEYKQGLTSLSAPFLEVYKDEGLVCEEGLYG